MRFERHIDGILDFQCFVRRVEWCMRVLCVVLVLAIGSVANAAFAVDLERLVMPGPVIAGHADIENDCSRCHRPFDAEAQSGLCQDCHEGVAKDVSDDVGLHGRLLARSMQTCQSCHTDHRGRETDITGLVAETFDHAQTDFALEGGHRGTACAACHGPDEAHRDAPGDCAACHGEADPHGGKLGDACGDCHSPAGWREARFDHAKTSFPLENAHADVPCGSCHPANRFEGVPKDCASCHAAKDVHRGRLGAQCGECHGTANWKSGSFDHDRETDFPLAGAHTKARCDACHASGAATTAQPRSTGKAGRSRPARGPQARLDTRCVACHAADDDHDGSFGVGCQTCHTPKDWRPRGFDHARDARFALVGQHAKVDCTSCHRGVLGKEDLAQQCGSCHAERDVHAGQLGERCDTCHGSAAWTRDVTFEHGVAAFPLLGLHAVAGCEACHQSPRFHDAPKACAECHARDDAHEGRLGADCSGCHNPNGWALWRFDHDRQTQFALRGKHAGLDCQACHTSTAGERLRISSRCESCHSLDDPHRGAFGARCETCHDERAWDAARVPR